MQNRNSTPKNADPKIVCLNSLASWYPVSLKSVSGFCLFVLFMLLIVNSCAYVPEDTFGLESRHQHLICQVSQQNWVLSALPQHTVHTCMTIESSIWVILKTVLFSICLQDPGHVSYPLRFSLPEPSACATDNRLAEMQPSAHCRGHLKCCGALFKVEGRNYLQDGGAAMKSVYNPQSSCFAL